MQLDEELHDLLARRRPMPDVRADGRPPWLRSRTRPWCGCSGASRRGSRREKDHLCELDSAVGDGDHGVSMTIGMRSVVRNLDELEAPTAAEAFRAAATGFADDVGAAIGPLYEELLEAAADVLERRPVAARDTWVEVFEAIAAATQRTGGAKPGDKTMVDAWAPAAAAMRREAEAGADLATCLERAPGGVAGASPRRRTSCRGWGGRAARRAREGPCGRRRDLGRASSST
jgi:phosphoenolpyruvate---glycerone phosphotransferase subunit DhaL